MATREIIRRDKKKRIQGDKSFIGDQEIIGKFLIRDKSYKLIYEFDPNANTVTVYDTSGNIIWQANTATGNITGIPREYYFPILDAGAASGGSDSFYTDGIAYKNLSNAEFTFDPSKFLGASIYLEVVGRAGASGDSLRTLTCRLYNFTDSLAISSSLATTTQTSSAPIENPGSWPIFRSGAITFTTGEKSYVFQFKSSDAGLFVNVQSARLIISY